jgi:hypothetical protein
MSLIEVSLNTLVNFTTTDPDEIEIMNKVNRDVLNNLYNSSKENGSNDYYWLGGQIKMDINDAITQCKINEARKIGEDKFAKYGFYNSMELASINYSKMKLNNLEEVFNNHMEILRFRYKNELQNKTHLNPDTINVVLDFI